MVLEELNRRNAGMGGSNRLCPTAHNTRNAAGATGQSATVIRAGGHGFGKPPFNARRPV